MDGGDLAVLGVGVGQLAVAGHDLGLEVGEVDQVLAGERVHPGHQRRARSRSTTKSSPWSMNACTGLGGPLLSRSLNTWRLLFEVVSGFCSEPDSANSFSMIFRVRTNQV